MWYSSASANTALPNIGVLYPCLEGKVASKIHQKIQLLIYVTAYLTYEINSKYEPLLLSRLLT